ncbi:hypothetical protein LZC95_37105 [Pendulispora brunnea]|uniref:Uncharacterized protein n=1 Tax=Pendulispora brunnea TaxID=2905690 RepID=A0ABZ2K1W4_9BACT
MTRSPRPIAALLIAVSSFHAAPVFAAGNSRAVARCTDAAVSGQKLRATGALRAASERFAHCIAPDCPGVIRRDCGKWLGEIGEAMPSMVFQVVDAQGNDVHDGAIFSDGEELAGAMEGRAVNVDPGSHIVAYVQGTERVEQNVVVREGERNRHLQFRLANRNVPVVPSFDKLPSSEPPPAQASHSPWPWVLGGAGVAALGVGTGFWIAGTNAHSDLGSSCAPTHSCSEDDVSSAKTKLVVGDILIGVGVAAVATAVVWLVTRNNAAPAESRAGARR